MTSHARPRRRRRVAALVAVAALLWLVARPVAFLALVVWRDPPARAPVPTVAASPVDDVSGLEAVAVADVVAIPPGTDEAVAALRALLARAAREGLAVSIAGARHSMGGHSLVADGVVADMTPHDEVSFDATSQSLRVGAGATWHDVLAFLDPLGLSVAVMQSNDSFTVGGSLSVNCHGWQHGRPPVAATVRSLRVVLADGRLVECSRTVEPELFSLVLGGYGLFGVILDAELDVVPNERYRHTATVVASEALGAEYLARASDPDVGLAIGRLSVDPDTFLEDAILRVLVREPSPGPLPALSPSGKRGLRRAIFRGSIGSAYGKELRWMLERRFATWASGAVTRNSELSEPVTIYANRAPAQTEILFEAFVPHEVLETYRRAIAPLFEASPCDLLNITVRDVRTDETTFLRYADRDMFSLVMLFHLERTPAADAELASLTRGLIDAALAVGGRYYLPYRRHATRAQFEAAYPMAPAFFAAKRRYDPDERFQSEFYRAYGR